MRTLNHKRRGASLAVIGAILVILIAIGVAYFAFNKGGTKGGSGSALEMAALIPADCHAAWGWDLNGQIDYVGWVTDFKELQSEFPEEDAQDFKKFEEELGMSLEDWLRMYDGRGFAAVVPGATPDKPGMVVAIGLADSAKYSEWWKKQSGSYGEEVKTQDIDGVSFLTVGDEPPLVGNDSQWLYIADSAENAKKLIASAKGGQNLNSLPQFQEGMKQLGNPAAGAFVFVPFEALVGQMKAANLEGTDEFTFTELAAFEYVVGTADFDGQQINGFLKVSGDSALAKQLLTPGTLSAKSLSAISQKVTNANSLDLQWTINTVLKLAALSPESRAQATLAGMGLMSQGDPWAAFVGDITVAGNTGETIVESLVPDFTDARGQGQLTACKSNLKNIGTAMEMYSTDYSGRYPDTMDLLTPNYLKTIPDCPAAGKNTYSATLKTGPNAPGNDQHFQDYYYFFCEGHNHNETAANYPTYDGIQGLNEGPVTATEEPEAEPERVTPSTVVVANLKDSAAGHSFLNKLLQIGGEPPKEGEETDYPAPFLMMMPGLSFKISNKGTPMAVFSYGPDSSKLLDTAGGDLTKVGVVKDLLAWAKDGIVYIDYMDLEPAYEQLTKKLKESDDQEVKIGLAALDKVKKRASKLEGGSCLVVRPNGLQYRAQGVTNVSFVGVGAAIMVPNFIRARGQGQLTACKSNLKNIGTGLEMYSTDYSGKYPKNLGLLTPNYLREIPECPVAGRDTYTESYRLEPP
ncbi:MAG: DUF3352 domain-containing protein, partial [Candidatus Eremiobacteraeota bacterium]|nr:DUF3352 domain-containing protein [Candidatus Eremiobacteraeota bacterium]